MWSDGGPAQPSPTNGQAINGDFPRGSRSNARAEGENVLLRCEINRDARVGSFALVCADHFRSSPTNRHRQHRSACSKVPAGDTSAIGLLSATTSMLTVVSSRTHGTKQVMATPRLSLSGLQGRRCRITSDSDTRRDNTWGRRTRMRGE
jgi:hypothetical protein